MRNFVIKADFECLVLLNGQEFGFINGQELQYSSNNRFVLSFFPTNSDYLPYTCLIEYYGGKLHCSNAFCSVTSLPNENYELNFFAYELIYRKPKLIFETELDAPIGKLTIQYFLNRQNQNKGYFQIFNKNALIFDFEVKEDIESIDVFGKYLGNDYFIFLNGQKDDYKYLLALQCDKEINLNLEVLAHKIEFFDNEIKTLSKCFDIDKHGKVCVYKVSNSKIYKADEYLVLLSENSVQKKDLIPYAFLENLLIKDLKKCREYMTNELSDAIDDEHLTSYFGEFIEVRQNLYSKNASSVLLIYGDESYLFSKVCEFEFVDNKINNINILD